MQFSPFGFPTLLRAHGVLVHALEGLQVPFASPDECSGSVVVVPIAGKRLFKNGL